MIDGIDTVVTHTNVFGSLAEGSVVIGSDLDFLEVNCMGYFTENACVHTLSDWDAYHMIEYDLSSHGDD